MVAEAPGVETTTARSTFHLAISATTPIAAEPREIWRLLADLDEHSRWNSTVSTITGEVALGRQVTFQVPQAVGQKFTATVIACEPPRLMRWRIDRRPLLLGERTYRLEPNPDGTTQFTVDEDFTGWILPLVARSWPDFVLIVERTAADLRLAAEPGGPRGR